MIKFNPPLNVVVSPTKTITVGELPLVIIDVQKTKTCKAQSAPFFKTVILWEGNSYDTIGNYTQEQAENRYLEILGNSPAIELAKLYVETPVKKV